MTTITAELAERFCEARRSGTRMRGLHHEVPALDLPLAYEIQRAFIALWTRSNTTRVAGYKVTAPDPDTQAMISASRPAYGALFEENLLASGSRLRMTELSSPLVEPELVFILDEPLSENPGADEVVSKTRVAAGLEIPQTRYWESEWVPNLAVTVADIVADNSASGHLVVGEPVPSSAVDLTAVTVELRHDGQPVATGRSSAVMGNPANSVAWLAADLRALDAALPQGVHVASGTFAPPLVVRPGLYEATFSGVGTVRVDVRD
ncbi:2-keto-4-pentenoate hydratase [Georgenia yuyongxinii]|uniref:2-keto-4-pentenoate hydratase n=1 Tax=Georgenia yuyongxinii TaxID=2589797 RepID=A0A552WXR8_9MICO|nr:2-keto-4-pentenoate hydratase [Georgenia yuyongxinii]TRW47618.1 2-keto-4-pentenoate hydratase [Georgenia yuyongxinii]